ncbi:MAG: hypothetical protein LUG96_01655 [Tannerellaceae bacterium]|nr:hypothetical protein [Tannerellaceae bacterium]
MPFASLVDMTYNGTQSRTIISENVITTFDFQTAQRIGVTANTKYYVSFYRANVVVNHPEAITYMQKDSPSCGIRPDKENWSTDFGYAGSISNGKFYMYSNVALINKEVGAAKELNKWYPRAPANLIWLYRIYTN